jgi:DNA-binding beta-propeller fold protein YncE
LLAIGLACHPALAEAPAAFSADFAAAGVRAKLELHPREGQPLLADQPMQLRLRLTAEGDAPARGLKPAAWAERSGGRAMSCQDRVRGLMENRLGRRAELDFNAWHVAYLGDNGAIQVLDPVGGTSRTRLLTIVNLGGLAGGWAEDPARGRLFVSLPEKGEVVEIDTARWAERRRLHTGGRPARLALDADGQRLWIGQDGKEGSAQEVVLIDREGGAVAARLPAGPGPHLLAAAGAGRAMVASAQGASLLQPGAATPLPQLGTGFTDAAYSALADATLLLDATAGRVLALARDGRVVGQWAVAPGASGLFPDPSGRMLFVPEPAGGRVTVIDLARNVIAHRVLLGGAPLRVGFSGTQAYVQAAAGATVSLIALGSLAEAGSPAVTTIAAGEGGLEPGEALGPMVAAAPGEDAMLIAAPAEKVVHVYMEGMAAPSGMLRVPRGRPLAITTVDHGLRETAPGLYETQATFPGAGRYILPVLLQGMDFLHCFEVDVGGEDATPLSKRLSLEFQAPQPRILAVGTPAALRIQLHGPEGIGTWREAGDLSARLVQFIGHWQTTVPMKPLGNGVYEAEQVTPPRDGIVQLYIESPSLGLEPGSLPYITLRAVSP